jgi:hypothetical protein
MLCDISLPTAGQQRVLWCLRASKACKAANAVCDPVFSIDVTVVCGAALQGAVRPPDAQTDPKVGHVGPVNDLVQCGPYICSAGEPWC